MCVFVHTCYHHVAIVPGIKHAPDGVASKTAASTGTENTISFSFLFIMLTLYFIRNFRMAMRAVNISFSYTIIYYQA